MLSPGTRLGSYEIVAPIGAGGMGEVYRARDTRLGRDVALKVLPELFAADTDRLARFKREAQVLASLNHPNIAAIHGFEESNDTQTLVLELVEGPTLADRIAEGPIPVDEALAIAKQIADALETAHEQEIVHRDLKPANIKLRPDGTVKVLDFGLAKALEPISAVGVNATASPTITSPAMMTGVGVLLGTAAYMSPEQARGKTVDKRSDIWAFGCVLYEMLTGRRAFAGDEVSDVLASVLAREPDWTLLPRDVLPAVRTLVWSCLEKDRRKRLQDIGAAVFVLDHAATLSGQTAEAPAAARWRRMLPIAATGVFAAVAAMALVVSVVWVGRNPEAPQVVRTVIPTSGDASLVVQGTDRDLVVTPDGTHVLYRGYDTVFVRRLDQLRATALSGVSGARGLFVSPDGLSLGFADTANMLKRVAIGGGPAVTLARMDAVPRGATWGRDGNIVFATGNSATGLQMVSAAGGDPIVLTKPDGARGEVDHIWPEYLPDSRGVLFTIAPVRGGMEAAQIAVFDFSTRTSKVILSGGSHAHYLPTGHLVYGTGGTLRAVAFDVDRLEVIGSPVPVLEGVTTNLAGLADVTFAANGMAVYVAGGETSVQRTLAWVDRAGREEPLTAPPRAYHYVRVSPDGTRVALDVRDQESDIWVWDVKRQTMTRLTFDPAIDGAPVWTPDARRIIFASRRAGQSNIFWQAADGTGAVEQLTDTPNMQMPVAIEPSGTLLILRETAAQSTTSEDLALLRLPRGQSEPLVLSPSNDMNAAVSPDGRWLAYESTESGRQEIFVRPFPDVAGGRWQVSTTGGRQPVWSHNGGELFYVGPNAAIMTVPVERGGIWQNGAPVQLFRGRYNFTGSAGAQTLGGTVGRTYDVAPNGRFLMIKEAAANDSVTTNIVVIQNWTEELKRLVPTN
jgi:Tol biopolymer transport system component